VIATLGRYEDLRGSGVLDRSRLHCRRSRHDQW
jgi:hypothetical protein